MKKSKKMAIFCFIWLTFWIASMAFYSVMIIGKIGNPIIYMLLCVFSAFVVGFTLGARWMDKQAARDIETITP